jgi:hypothetical protein
MNHISIITLTGWQRVSKLGTIARRHLAALFGSVLRTVARTKCEQKKTGKPTCLADNVFCAMRSCELNGIHFQFDLDLIFLHD